MSYKTHENKPYKFITKDFTGESEVMVLKGKGIVSLIEERPESGTAQVHIQIFAPGEGAKPLKPEKAWYSLENEKLHNYIKEAKASGREVSYRIDIKRKAGIDAKLPFMDLYQNMDDARENTIRILSLIDNVESDEAVTNPADDPVFSNQQGKTVSEMQAERTQESNSALVGNVNNSGGAGLNPVVLMEQLREVVAAGDYSQTLVDSIAALALAAGVPADAVNSTLYPEGKAPTFKPATEMSRTFAVEAPRWQEFNSDGRLNLGSGRVASGVSLESAVSRNILNGVSFDGNPLDIAGFNELVAYFTDLSYAICDYSQARMYGQGSRPDRKAESHTRVRGIFIDLLERFFVFPVELVDGKLFITSSPDVDEWVKKVGGTIIQRFTVGINASGTHKRFGELKDELSSLPLLVPVAEQNTPVESPVRQAQSSVEPEAPSQSAVESPVTSESVVPEQTAYEPPAETSESYPEAPMQTAETYVEAPAQSETSQLDNTDRLNVAAEIIKNFVPTEGIYTQDDEDGSSGGLIPAEESVAGNYDFVSSNVIRLPVEKYSNPGDELATPEDVETFKLLLDELGFNLEDRNERVLIGRIIKFTFGESYNKLQEIPSELIGQFVDWYASAGAEAINELRGYASE